MADIRGNKVHRALSEKGFTPKNGPKHIIYKYYFKGKKTRVYTFMSRPPGMLNDNLIGIMAKQTKLEKKEFIELVECTLKKEDLLQIYLTHKKLS
jgi:hypothetical protein